MIKFLNGAYTLFFSAINSCADPVLCFPNEHGQLLVNPNSRLALRAECSVEDGSDCTHEMLYQWKLQNDDMIV